MATEFVPRVALITGAGQGIGREIALRLADDGLDVGLNDIPSNVAKVHELISEIQAKGHRAISLIGDVSIEQDVVRMVETTVAELGSLDVMIANAGIASTTLLVNVSVEQWDRVMATNVRGVMLCYKYAAKQMIKQGRGGRIIGASSICGKKGPKSLSAYAASKFAVRGLTQSAALELAEHNITVNAYAPGIILTQMAVSDTDKHFGGRPGDALAHILGNKDAPRAGPEVVASVVSYLVKPEAHFITGQSISVSGGLVMD